MILISDNGRPALSEWENLKQLVFEFTQDDSAYDWSEQDIWFELSTNEIYPMSQRELKQWLKDGNKMSDIEIYG